jgi:hypothetical protein
LRWVEENCDEAKLPAQGFAWSHSLAKATDEALAIAANYQELVNCFSMWHQNKELADLLSGSVVRFTVPGGVPARRVSAFQKGFKPNIGSVQNAGIVLDEEQERLRNAVLSRCFCAGYLAMAYPEPLELYLSLSRSNLERVNALFRHADSVSVGPYILGDLKPKRATGGQLPYLTTNGERLQSAPGGRMPSR